MKKILLILIVFYNFLYAGLQCGSSDTSGPWDAPNATLISSASYSDSVFDSTDCYIPNAVISSSGADSGFTSYSVSLYKGTRLSSQLVSLNVTTKNYRVCNDSTKKYNSKTYSCEPFTPEKCPEGQTKVNGKCVAIPKCDFGYHNDSSQTGSPCVPDKECPPTMNYYAKEVNWGFDLKICTPRQDLNPDDCAKAGGSYADPTNLTGRINAVSSMGDVVTAMGKGCYDAGYTKSLSAEKAIGEALSFGTAKIDKAFLAQLGKTVFGAGKTMADYIKGFFTSNASASEQGLLGFKPEFVDVKIQDDGTYAVMDYKARDAIFNDLNGKPTIDLGTPNGEKIYAVDTPDIIPDNVYLGGDINEFGANIIGTKSYLDEAKPFVMPETTPLNGVTQTAVDLKNSIYGTEKSKFPATSTLLEKSTNAAGEVKTLTQTKINYPDGTYTQIDTLATKLADATKKYEVTTTTPIKTNTGLKVYEQKATYTENATGTITNKVTTPATVKFVDESGYVASQPNVSTSSAPTSVNTGTINLSGIQASLNKINQQLADLNAYVREAPKNIAEFNTALDNFKTNMTDWSMSMDNAVTFIGGFKDKLLGLENTLNDALNKFQDKPELNLPSGQCPFQAHWYRDNFTVDPCKFISPYRPILVAFFTLWFSIHIFFFSLKFFFRVGE